MTLAAVFRRLKEHFAGILLATVAVAIAVVLAMSCLPKQYGVLLRIEVEASPEVIGAQRASVVIASQEEAKYVLDYIAGDIVKERIGESYPDSDPSAYRVAAQIAASGTTVEAAISGSTEEGAESFARLLSTEVVASLHDRRDPDAQVSVIAESLGTMPPDNRVLALGVCSLFAPIYIYIFYSSIRMRYVEGEKREEGAHGTRE